MTLPPETDYSEPRPRGTVAGASIPLRSTRSQARRSHRGVRVLDVTIGLIAGVLAVALVPGIALAGIGAVIVLALAGLSLLFPRLRARRRARTLRRRR